MSLESFLASVAEPTPAPGGGAGAAAACALGAALAEMVAQIAGLSDEAVRAGALRAEALRLGEADLAAYAPVLEALRLSVHDPQRAARVAAAESAAANVPLAIAEAAAQVAVLARGLVRTEKRHLVGDALAGADIALGACRAAARLVEMNLAAAPSDPRVARARAAVERAEG